MKKEKILYLGLDPSHFSTKGDVYHHPIIQIIPRNIRMKIPQKTTHVLLTSKTAVVLFLDQKPSLSFVRFIAIGKVTALTLKKKGIDADWIASRECGEGIIDILKSLDLSGAHIFFPHSSLSRPLITNYMRSKKISFTEVILYDTIVNKEPLPDIAEFDEIVFTSPSSVDAFFSFHKLVPKNQKITAIGPITQKRVDKYV